MLAAMPAPPTEAAVLAALSQIQDPDLHRDVVSLGMIKDLEVQGSAVSLKVELTTPACPLKETISKDVEAALRGAGASAVKITWGAQVRSAPGVAAASLTPGVKNIILVGAGKGGVGKSTVAINLAVALAMLGARVGLMDADVYGPNMPVMMGVNDQPTQMDKKLVPLEAHGVKVMSMGFLLDPDQPVIWRGPMLHGVMKNFVSDVLWGELDYLVVDLPPGTGDVALSLAQMVPVSGAVVVTTPQEVSLADTSKAVAMYKKLQIHVLGLVENMSYYVCPHCHERDA